MHWGARQNKLETRKDKDEFNKQDIHECDGRAHDPDTMVAPPTPRPKRKAKALTMTPPSIDWGDEEDAALRKWRNPRYRCASCILETKTKAGSTAGKAPAPRTNPNINEAPTAPKPHTHPSHECDGQAHDPGATAAPPTPKPTRKAEALTTAPPIIGWGDEEDAALKEVAVPQYRCASCILETKTKVGSTAAKALAPRINPARARRFFFFTSRLSRRVKHVLGRRNETPD